MFARVGGKRALRKLILSKFPKDYTTYVEPFLGAGNIALYAPPVKKMIAGDTDSFVIETFKAFQKVPKEQILEMNFRPSKKRFIYLRDKFEPTTEAEILYRNLYLTNNSFLGIRRTYQNKSTGKAFKKNVEKFKEQLRHFKIVKASYEKLIGEYDSSTTFFYLDPPYAETYSGIYETGNINHEHLAKILRNVKGKFLLSHDDTPYIRKLYQGFKIQKHKVFRVSTGDYVYEVLISNY